MLRDDYYELPRARADCGASPLRTDSGPQEHARRRDGCRTRSASNRDNTVTITNEGDNCEPNSQQRRQGGRIAGGDRRRDGGRRSARRCRSAPASAWGVSATGPITIAPVALAETGATPRVSAGVVYPGLTTGGILDRASSDSAFSQVGSPKVYFPTQPVDQLNASLLSILVPVRHHPRHVRHDDHPGRLDHCAQRAGLLAHPAAA